MDTDTAIIGGGQAGLAASHCLTQRNIPHLVLERHRIAERWRTERWDSLRFQFPNWSIRLPGLDYQGNDPDGFAHRDDIVRLLETYAARIAAPVRTGANVTALRPTPTGFALETQAGTITARNVIVATGPYQQPAIPPAADGLPDASHVPASAYRNPGGLPPGGVLIVGSGASGIQIAEELLLAGRPTYLAVGPHRRVPRRYRTRDIIWWINALGLDDQIATPASAARPPLLISGAYGGRTIDLRALATQGMTLLGRLDSARDGTATFAPDLAANLANGDESFQAFLRTANAHADTIGLPPEHLPPSPSPGIAPITSLNLRAEGINTVIWATGYRYDFTWIEADIFQNGAPVHRRGVTAVPGLYFLGLPFLHKTKSSFLSGVADDAAHLADQIAQHATG